MIELGILAGAAVGIAGDFIAGVAQNMAAGAVTDLIRQRLGSTDEGQRALEGLESHPEDSGQRMEAAGILASVAQNDPSFAETLKDAVASHHQETHQGSASSGSPHHQVNISGGGVSGKRHLIAGGNIDASKKRTIRVGMGAFAVLVVVLGGFGASQVWGSDRGAGERHPTAEKSTGDVSHVADDGHRTRKGKTLTFDFSQKGEEDFWRTRGSLSVTPGLPQPDFAPCSLSAPAGSSIVPVILTVANGNSPAWDRADSKFDSSKAKVDVTASSKDVAFWGYYTDPTTGKSGCALAHSTSGHWADSPEEPGKSLTATLLLVGVPEGQETDVTITVSGPNCCVEGATPQHKSVKFSVHG